MDQITIEDFNTIKMNLFKTGQTRMQGDLTKDAIVDFADFRQWKAAAGPGIRQHHACKASLSRPRSCFFPWVACS